MLKKKPKFPQLPDETLPILTLNPASNATNFPVFKRKLRTVVLTNFKTLEDCIEFGDLEDLEEFDLPDEDELAGLSSEDDPGGIKAHVLKERVEESYKDYITKGLELKTLFGIIIDHLSLESLQRVKSSDTFNEIEAELHGFKL